MMFYFITILCLTLTQASVTTPTDYFEKQLTNILNNLQTSVNQQTLIAKKSLQTSQTLSS